MCRYTNCSEYIVCFEIGEIFDKGRKSMNAFELVIAQATGNEEERLNSVLMVERALQPFVVKVSSFVKGALIAEFSPALRH